MGEKQVRKFGRQSISLMLCRVLLNAVNVRHGTDGLTSPPKEGPVASTLTTRPPRAFRTTHTSTKTSVMWHPKPVSTTTHTL
jgi:hypothetical protein